MHAGIKNGRYTLKKISEDITTVKQLQAREAVTTWMLNEKKFSPSAERLVVTLADARQKHMDTWINYEIRTLELTKLYMVS